jgi:hypothetical protein
VPAEVPAKPLPWPQNGRQAPSRRRPRHAAPASP